jgi:hypothetical protein
VAALEDFNLDEAADGMVADMMPLWSELLEVSGDEAIAALGVEVDVDWSQSNPYVRDVLDRLGTRIRGVADTTRDDVRRLVEQGNERGDSVRQIADFIRERAPEISKSRSQLIARTESSTGANLGAVIAYRAAGIDRVKVLDGDGDPECAAADGQIWTLEEADANPIAHPGCVRAFAPVVEEGQEPQEQAPEAPQEGPGTFQSADEAQAWADANLKTRILGFGNAGTDVVNEVVGFVAEFEGRAGKGIPGQILLSNKRAGRNYATAHRKDRVIAIREFKSLADFEDERVRAETEFAARLPGQRWQVSTDLRGMLYHETGHMIDFAMGDGGTYYAAQASVGFDWSRLSGYAATKPIEAWAEAVAAVATDHPSAVTLPDKVVDQIRTILGGK